MFLIFIKMGVGYSVIYERGNGIAELPIINQEYFPITMLCRRNIITFNSYNEFMASIYIKESDYLILSKVKRGKVKILKDLENKSFKYELKRFGVISKVNDYYIFSRNFIHKIIIYSLLTNERVFDYRFDSIFKFDMKGKYSIYVLE